MKSLYLDHNSTSPIDPQVLSALIRHLEEGYANPSSIHADGRKARLVLDQCRQTVARFFSVKPQSVIFTSGGTEGASLLIRGLCEKNPEGKVISSTLEHACVFETLNEIKNQGTPVDFLSSDQTGWIDPSRIAAKISSKTKLLAFMAANNETGVITDIAAIGALASAYNIPFVVDGVALLGKEIVSIPSGVSAMFFSGHKIGAPKGIGCCIVNPSLKVKPLFIGGGQEMNLRAGTENLSGIVAFAEAIGLLQKEQGERIKHMRMLRDLFESELSKSIPHLVVNGAGNRVSNTSNLAFMGISGEKLLMQLDLAGISASHGSACSSGSLEPSRILKAMGLGMDRVNSSIRFSFGPHMSIEDVQRTVAIIRNLV